MIGDTKNSFVAASSPIAFAIDGKIVADALDATRYRCASEKTAVA